MFVYILQILLLFVGLFLMLIILLQRGRGGGLAGAFGGAGGQSAFGTKAGDVFTWITVVTATVWVLLAGISGCVMRYDSERVSRQFESGTDDEELVAPEGESGAADLPIVPADPAPPAGTDSDIGAPSVDMNLPPETDLELPEPPATDDPPTQPLPAPEESADGTAPENTEGTTETETDTEATPEPGSDAPEAAPANTSDSETSADDATESDAQQ